MSEQRPPGGERGSGGMLVASIVLVLVTAAGVGAWIAAWYGCLEHARSAADLASVAGAQARAKGADACEAARYTASRNAARVTLCAVAGDDRSFTVTVRVAVPLRPAVPHAPRQVEATSKAGSV